MLRARPYQLEALEAVKSKRVLGVTRQLISLPTGCGKTVVFSLLAKELKEKTLVIAHTEELISQAVQKLSFVCPELTVGIVKASQDELTADIVVASIQTASRDKRLKKMAEVGFNVLIIDEAHHATADSYKKVIKKLGFMSDPKKLMVGVTATPKRGDGLGLRSVFQEIVYERTISTMVRAKYLSPLIGKQVLTKVELNKVDTQKGDFVASQLSKIVNTPERNKLIVDTHKVYANDRKKTLAFCADVKHAKDLAKVFCDAGVPSKAVYGSMKSEERKELLEEFHGGGFSVLTNCQLLTEGFDEPSIDCLVMGRPTQSSALFTQMIGRGTRTSPLKKDCLVLDFTDNALKHQLCSTKNTLDGAISLLEAQLSDEEEEEEKDPNEHEIVDLKASYEIKIIKEKIEEIEFFDSTVFAWEIVKDAYYLKLSATSHVWLRKTAEGYLIVACENGTIVSLADRPLPLDYALGVTEDWARSLKDTKEWAKRDAPWRHEEATYKQKMALQRAGIAVDKDISKGEAAQILSSLYTEPATPKQIYCLRGYGIDGNTLTKAQAQAAIAKRKKEVYTL